MVLPEFENMFYVLNERLRKEYEDLKQANSDGGAHS